MSAVKAGVSDNSVTVRLNGDNRSEWMNAKFPRQIQSERPEPGKQVSHRNAADAMECDEDRNKGNGTERHEKDERERVDATSQELADEIEAREREARQDHVNDVDREHYLPSAFQTVGSSACSSWTRMRSRNWNPAAPSITR